MANEKYRVMSGSLVELKDLTFFSIHYFHSGEHEGTYLLTVRNLTADKEKRFINVNEAVAYLVKNYGGW